jgi:putative membrane-bound dehydrogenase-like protein
MIGRFVVGAFRLSPFGGGCLSSSRLSTCQCGASFISACPHNSRVGDWSRRGAVLKNAACCGAVAAVFLAVMGIASLPPIPSHAQEVIPRNQDRPPGPPLSPEEAVKKMTVPDGFSVEIVAAEPDLMNPVAMTFDERGRIWVTESFEYPRREPGPGRDRVKVLEDTDGDGRVDKTTVFAEGLNIPSGIAVGHGGVWVANAPDILFLQDTDNDGKADKSTVVVTGFGRTDTHELPNSLTWGPDGYLYGLNGVFNHSKVTHHGKTHEFTCALFRIHPRTRTFELFAEGTSNPWGIAWDPEGGAFVSACVIDHLWHLTESGYYHRQGGPYPPFTWKIDSIVAHKHQKAAYCGIHYFDSDAYPAAYRDKLYMGNVHGGCINVDSVRRDGSTYRGEGHPDFLTANDAWFMPVVQKTGPDGCLYILDWYDRYHCYQDANRDPQGIDRLKGRLYRVRYGDSPRAPKIDLGRETDEQLIDRLRSPNVFHRDMAQRLLAERASPAATPRLEALALNTEIDRKYRLHALWALAGSGPLRTEFHARLLDHADPAFRAWGVRLAGNQAVQRQFAVQAAGTGGKSDNGAAADGATGLDAALVSRVVKLASDTAPDVKLQVAIAARKLPGVDPLPVLLETLVTCGDDRLIPHIVWQNLHPLLETRGPEFLRLVKQYDLKATPNLAKLMPRVTERILAKKK